MTSERPRARALRLLRATAAEPIAAGLPLPPERLLADQYQVSRTTIRWALAQLAREGLLRNVTGRTRLVADPSARPAMACHPVYVFSQIEESHVNRSEGWGGNVHVGLLNAMRSLGHAVLIPGSSLLDEATVACLLRERPAGVLIPEPMYTGASDPSLMLAAEAFAKAGIPTVVFGEFPAACDRVCSDHELGAHLLSTWLLNRGRRHQLCLWPGPSTPAWLERRRIGHERALRESGVVIRPVEWMNWLSRDEDFETLVLALAGHLAPHLLSAQPIDSILAMIDGHVPAICAALRHCGREPGRDVDVVGYDALWAECPQRLLCPVPPAASIDKCNLQIGKAMATLLDERMAGILPPEPQLRQIAPRLAFN